MKKKKNIYIYIYSFSSSWNEKKKTYEKKRRKTLQAAAGLLPIFSMHWATIQQLYRDTEAGKAGLGAARGPRHGQLHPLYDHGRAAIRPRHGP